MRLFTSREAKEMSHKQTEEKVQVISFLTGEEARLKLSINRLNDDFEETLKRHREAFAREKASSEEELRQIEDELRERREERKRLLVPIRAIEERAAEKEALAETLKEKALERLGEAEELIHKTTALAAALDEKAAILDAEAESISRKREAIESEATMVSEGHRRLNDEITAFRSSSAEIYERLSQKEARMNAEVKAREIIHEEKEKSIAKREASLVSREKKLADERAVLERAWNELRRKQ